MIIYLTEKNLDDICLTCGKEHNNFIYWYIAKNFYINTAICKEFNIPKNIEYIGMCQWCWENVSILSNFDRIERVTGWTRK